MHPTSATFNTAHPIGEQTAGRRQLAFKLLLVILIAAGISSWLTWPLIVVMRDHSLERGDSRLNAYLHAWGVHALLSDPSNLFNTNMFYPARDTFALSENLLGNQIFFAPIYLITGNPNLGNNVVTFLSFVLCFCTMCWLVQWATGSTGAGLVAGLVFSFAPARISQLGHNQLMTTEWLPLVVIFLYRYLLRKKVIDLVYFSAVVVMQLLCSLYLGYFGLIVASTYAFAVLVTQPLLFDRRTVLRLLSAAAIVVLLMLPLLTPYHRLSHTALHQELQLQTDASAEPRASYLHTHGHAYRDFLNRFHSLHYDWEKQLFVGFLPSALALLGMMPMVCHRRRAASVSFQGTHGQNPPGFFLGSFLLTGESYVLSLGPFLHLHDAPTRLRLPFYYFCKIIPGFSSFRAPARFGMLFMFGFGILAAFGVVTIQRGLRRARVPSRLALQVALIAGILAGTSWEYRYAPFPYPSVMTPATLSPEYRWIASRPSSDGVVELPIKLGANGFPYPYEEAFRVYASAYHWHPLLNGYSGHWATITASMYSLAESLPSSEAADILSGLGVRYVILHTDEMKPAELQAWQGEHPADHMRRITELGPAVIFELVSSDCLVGMRGNSVASLALPEIAAAGQKIPVEVLARSSNSCWANAKNGGDHRLQFVWHSASTGKETRVESEAAWPVYAAPNQAVRGPEVLVRSPNDVGRYFVTVKLLEDATIVAAQEVLLRTKMKPLVNSTAGLSASYEPLATPTPDHRGRVLVDLRVRNTGTTLWTVGPQKGGVRLGYTWYDRQKKQLFDGRLDFPYQLYPGASYTFQDWIPAPKAPGRYGLKLQLVAELISWFDRLGVPPVEYSVTLN